MLNKYKQALETLKNQDNYRSLSLVDPTLINLNSNDYLGLNQTSLHKRFIEQQLKEAPSFSSSSSRLLSGHSKASEELEELLGFAYRKTCLTYNSGYHLNIGILPALTDKKDLIISDKLVHASIIDGLKLSEADKKRFNHLDYEHLENILSKYRHQYEQVFIVSESIFSMDGDIADIKTLVKLKHQYNTFLYIDEAHAVGVRGTKGLGICEETNTIQDIDFIVGSFGKALCSIGGFIICEDLIRSYLINRSRSLIFTTALPPINIEWTKFIFEKQQSMNSEREKLKKLSQDFSRLINIKGESHIIPYIVGSNTNTLNIAKKLEEAGYKTAAIRHPTVPIGTSRLRFSLNAKMDIASIQPISQLLR